MKRVVPALALLAAGLATADEVSPRLQQARELMQATRYEEAAKAFAAAGRVVKGGCAECLAGEARARLALGDHKGARKAAEKALPLLAGNPTAQGQAHTFIGLALMREGGTNKERLREAEAAFRAALAASPGEATARFNLGTVLLRQSRDEEGVAELRAFLEATPTSPGADRAREYVANPRRARERFAPDFTVKTLAGEELSLASLRGKVVVLDFWGTWCGPCVASLPELKDLVRRYDPGRLVLLSVNVGDEEVKWRAFVERNGMSWPQCRDGDRRLTEAFGVKGFPTYIVLDGEGAIVAQVAGLEPQQSVGFRLRERLTALVGHRSAERPRRPGGAGARSGPPLHPGTAD